MNKLAPIAFLILLVVAAPAFAAETLRVGMIPVLSVAPILVADQEGWIKDAGFDLKYSTFQSGPDMIQALVSGTLDVYVAGITALPIARSKGVDVTVVTATSINETTVVAGPKLASLFKPGVAPALSFHQFREQTGKPARLATQQPGSTGDITLQYWLRNVAKADKADYQITPIGIDAAQQALLVGAVDGATAREPADTILQQRDPHIKIIALGGVMFPSQPGTVVAVSGGFLKRDRAGVQRLVDALVKAGALIQSDHKRVTPAVEAALGKGLIDAPTIERALASPATNFISDPRLIIDATAKMGAFQASIGALDAAPPIDGLFDSSFYESAILRVPHASDPAPASAASP